MRKITYLEEKNPELWALAKETEKILVTELINNEGGLNKKSRIFDKNRYIFLKDKNNDIEWLWKNEIAFLNTIKKEKEVIKNKFLWVFLSWVKKENIKYAELETSYNHEINKLEEKKWKKSGLPLDFSAPVWKGNYGLIFRSLEDPCILVKVCNIPDFETYEDLQKMVAVGKKINNPKIALPLEVLDVWDKTYVIIMKDVSEKYLSHLPDLSKEEMEKDLYNNLKLLKKEWIFVDWSGWKNFILSSKWYSIMDLNTIPKDIKKKTDQYSFRKANSPFIPLKKIVKKKIELDTSQIEKIIRKRNIL